MVKPAAPIARNTRNKMGHDTQDASAELKPPTDDVGSMSRGERVILNEIVEVLSAHPRGRRRWSVMRAIRASRVRLGRDIPHKFEDEVERTFRRHCSGSAEPHPLAPRNALFYRPKETAGEVWAILPAREANLSSTA
jgi:hypothetical protein